MHRGYWKYQNQHFQQKPVEEKDTRLVIPKSHRFEEEMDTALSTWCSPGRIEDKYRKTDRFGPDLEKRTIYH
jgi:hypothetical protein